MTVDTSPAPLLVTHIRASGGWRGIDVRELWRFRDLLYFLTLRDIKLRYKQTALGVLWAVGQPLLTVAVFTLLFGKVGGFADKLEPHLQKYYFLFVLAALTPWQLFAYALTQSSNSLVNEQRLITKVYFPRLIVPVSSVLSGLVDFLVTLTLMAVLMAASGFVPGLAVLLLPVFVFLAVLTAMSVGLWLSALNVQYRDVRYTIPFLTQFWLFATPVLYPSSLVREKLGDRAEWVFGLNPMAGVVEGFRWALLDTAPPNWGMMAVSVTVVLVLLGTGLMYFRRMERFFADVV
ncbi:MAG: ABC transporter permease [Fimbriiglobus sp.]